MKKLLIVFCMLLYIAYSQKAIITAGVNIRKAPNGKSEIIIDSIPVEIINSYSDYYMIQVVAGSKHANDGKIYKAWAKGIIKKEEKFYIGGEKASKGLTLRIEGEKNRYCKAGAEIIIIKKIPTWYEIKLSDGKTGWVYKTNITLIKE